MKKRIQTVQGLRGFLFLVIFFSHVGLIPNDSGGFAVSAFFVLSGFVLYLSNIEKEMPCGLMKNIQFTFYKVKKLYPIHLIMIAPAMVIELALIFIGRSAEPIGHVLLRLIPNIFLWHTWIPVKSVYFGFNGVSWYLSTHVFLMFAFPFLLKLMKKAVRTKGTVIIICMGCFIVPILVSLLLELSGHSELREWLLYCFPPIRICELLAGMQCAWLYKNTKFTSWNNIVTSIAEFAVLGLFVVSILFLELNRGGYAIIANSSILAMPLSCLTVLLAATECGVCSRILRSKAMVYIGNLSMYTFLIHQQIIQYTHIIYANALSRTVNLFVVALISMIITWILTVLYIKIIKEANKKRNE